MSVRRLNHGCEARRAKSQQVQFSAVASLSSSRRALPLSLATMDSIFENQRQTHEEIERLQRALSTVLSHSYPTQQAHIANQHKAAQLLDRIVARVHELNSLYEDDDGRKAELNALSAPVAAPGTDDLAEFYTRLGRTREHHMKYPDSVVGAFEAELATLVEEPLAGEYEDEDRACPALFGHHGSLTLGYLQRCL